jgi:hypothetical protein
MIWMAAVMASLKVLFQQFLEGLKGSYEESETGQPVIHPRYEPATFHIQFRSVITSANLLSYVQPFRIHSSGQCLCATTGSIDGSNNVIV